MGAAAAIQANHFLDKIEEAEITQTGEVAAGKVAAKHN
jgi:hypothetical protein